MNPASNPTKLPTSFFVFLFGVFIYRTGWFMTLPFMAIYLSRDLGADPISIGVILGAGPLLACFTGLLAGSLSDRFGAKTVMLIGVFCSLIIFILFCLTRNLVMYGVLNLFLGIARSSIDTASQAYVAYLLPAEQRAKGLNMRYITLNLSAVFGPLIGAKVILMSAHILFLATAAVYLLTFLTLMWALKQFVNTKQMSYWEELRISVGTLLRDKAAVYLFLVAFFVCFTFAQIDTTLPQIMALRPIAHYIHVYSWLLVINALMIVFLQLPLGQLLSKYSPIKFAYLAVAFYIVAFVSFAFANHISIFVIAMVLFTLGEIISAALYNFIVDRIAPPTMKGLYFGIISFAMVGFSFGTLIGGVLLKYFGGVVLFNCVAIFAASCFIFYTLCRKHSHAVDKAW
jgi:MFS family permease